jgi:hypothetical protein
VHDQRPPASGKPEMSLQSSRSAALPYSISQNGRPLSRAQINLIWMPRQLSDDKGLAEQNGGSARVLLDLPASLSVIPG